MDNLRVKNGHTKKTQAPRIPARAGTAKAGAFAVRGANPQGQDVWANIWCAVLAVGEGGGARLSRLPGPEVLLSLLPTNPTLYRRSKNQEPLSSPKGRTTLQDAAPLLELAVALQGGRVLGRSHDQGVLLLLDGVDEHAVEQAAQLGAQFGLVALGLGVRAGHHAFRQGLAVVAGQCL